MGELGHHLYYFCVAVQREKRTESAHMKTNALSLMLTSLLTGFAFLQPTQAVVPPPDGGYPNGNTAEGTAALLDLGPFGFNNTAIGFMSLKSNTQGDANTAVGAGALFSNRGEGQNTATGAGALFNSFGANNTANGAFALYTNGLGSGNTAMGSNALYSNRTAFANTAIGYGALFSNTGEDFALGAGNTAIGFQALYNNTTGNTNTALGGYAGWNRTTGDFNIDIGSEGVEGESNTIRIGDDSVNVATFIAGISGQNASGGDPVFVTNTGKLGTINLPSSARFKDEIKPMDKASEVILALKPVTFHYKKEIDPNGLRQFGLVAEEVEKVARDLVKRDHDGKLQTVRYDQVNAMLLNEFLKEHGKVEKLEATVTKQEVAAAKQEAKIAQQQKQIEALTAGLQRVSAQLELNKAAPRTVLNNQ
jgi:trimeric autotransporter adhesin